MNELNATIAAQKRELDAFADAKQQLEDKLSKNNVSLASAEEKFKNAKEELAKVTAENDKWQADLKQAKDEVLANFTQKESQSSAVLTELQDRIDRLEVEKKQSQQDYVASVERQHELEAKVNELSQPQQSLEDQIKAFDFENQSKTDNVPAFDTDFPDSPAV